MPRKKRGWVWATAVVLVIGATGGNAALIAALSDREPVLVLARDVPWGKRISQADVQPVELSADVTQFAVPDTDRGTVVGQVAGQNLHAGGLLAYSDLARQAIPAAGQQVLGLRLEPGRFPVRGLLPNDPVAVHPAPEQTTTSTQQAEPGAEFTARVVRSSPPDAEGAITADLLIPDATASEAVAAAVGGAQVSLLGPDHQ
ncbi:hypothetical protein INP57_25695 [Saccharopolyspora sp. HNM0986]|uniref:SAF domain-containing protein n=1 Tax=Saccharopolyspora galaxeae TaxID=2781241 RepID=UPI00190CA68A|nr:SAF domain-containing protein [Saccharopolyspora sp. HNM0986]MBK0870209.1 hypothetical protein [Saccharopolyspora sp. HNM0986]